MLTIIGLQHITLAVQLFIVKSLVEDTMNLQAITRCSQVLHACLTCDARALLL